MARYSYPRALFMWSLPLTFFAYQFILRLMPGLVIDEVMALYQVNASDFGLMSALYYWGYAGMQIPVAILLDRYSARSVISMSAILTALGTLLFIYGDLWSLALLGRFLVGIGSAVGFLGTSKVLSQWFPANRYAWYVGLSFSIGLLGALYGGKPVARLAEQFSWQPTFAMIALLGLVIAAVVYMFLRSPEEVTETSVENLKELLSQVVRRPTLWVLAFCNLLMVGPLEGFADVWGVAYFMKAFSWDKKTAAGLSSFVYIGMLFGGPVLTYLAKQLKSESGVLVLSGVGMCLMFMVLLMTPFVFQTYTLAGSMFVVGILCCYQVLIFSVGRRLVAEPVQGIAVAFLNCVNMAGGAFYHSVIGIAMDARAEQSIAYRLADYQFALSVIPMGCLAGALGILALIYRKRFSSHMIEAA